MCITRLLGSADSKDVIGKRKSSCTRVPAAQLAPQPLSAAWLCLVQAASDTCLTAPALHPCVSYWCWWSWWLHQAPLKNYVDGSNVPKDKQDVTFQRARKAVEQWKPKAVFLRNYTTQAVHQVHEQIDFVYVDARVSDSGCSRQPSAASVVNQPAMTSGLHGTAAQS